MHRLISWAGVVSPWSKNYREQFPKITFIVSKGLTNHKVRVPLMDPHDDLVISAGWASSGIKLNDLLSPATLLRSAWYHRMLSQYSLYTLISRELRLKGNTERKMKLETGINEKSLEGSTVVPIQTLVPAVPYVSIAEIHWSETRRSLWFPSLWYPMVESTNF